ncbi:HmuY family protein [Algivirga pacifica]|uniref:HmuY protein n=1 Tax=Algivirga pacifica TaxID=1162670 RepID=A0ABP9DJB2_9BACT
MKKLSVFALALTSLLWSCDTTTVDPVNTDAQELQVVMGEEYTTQVFVNLDQDEEEGKTLSVESTANDYVVFDFTADQIPTPNNLEGWDILFTNYKINIPVSATEFQAYDVTGVLINTEAGAMAVAVDSSNYAEVDLARAQSMELSTEMQAVGYNWKSLNFDTFQYDIVADKYYVIKTAEGEYFKLRFLDFYLDGVKGTPGFEYQRLR